MNEVRTRFAPSPTGYLHVGGVRAALFPWLVARHYNGKFILRIEDTDRAREVGGSVDIIKQSLEWLGILWDEGPDIGGAYGPYFQTQRTQYYHQWAMYLLNSDRAYADIRQPGELEQLRADAQTKHKPFLIRDYRPSNPPSWKPGIPLRFKSEPQAYSWHDEIMGDLTAGKDAVDDFILLKSDGLPTYNFGHIVDDQEMHITHVIRGLEYIASMPKYLNLYEALGFNKPLFAHMPHIMGPDGKKKLSKRDGAKSVLDYKHEGFLPEAMVNFLALLGWNPGDGREMFSLDELVDSFSLDRVQHSGARFDERRLIWMNGNYIRLLSLDELYDRCAQYWPVEAKNYDNTYKKQVLKLLQERLKYLSELPELSRLFFVDLPLDPKLISTHKQLSKYDNQSLKRLLETSLVDLKDCDFSVDKLNDRLNGLLAKTGEPPAVLFSLIRIATTQAPASPPLAESLAVIGKERTLKRIVRQIEAL